ncbi:hypothetical protein [Anaerosporobacter sp.]
MKYKKTISFLLMITLLSVLPVGKAKAVSGFELSYWYSDSNSIAFWDISTLNTYVGSNVTTNANLSVSNIKNYVTTGFDNWNSSTNLSKKNSSQSSADLVIGGITEAEANSLYLAPNLTGLTTTPIVSVYTGYYNGSTKQICKISGTVKTFLINRSAFSSFSSSKWKQIAVHEIGHAMGYDGHYNSGNVMPADAKDLSSASPSSNEKKHLSQVY